MRRIVIRILSFFSLSSFLHRPNSKFRLETLGALVMTPSTLNSEDPMFNETQPLVATTRPRVQFEADTTTAILMVVVCNCVPKHWPASLCGMGILKSRNSAKNFDHAWGFFFNSCFSILKWNSRWDQKRLKLKYAVLKVDCRLREQGPQPSHLWSSCRVWSVVAIC